MARTLNLTGFQIGDSLSLSVSQGALTAGPVNVTSWGGPTGGGTISINVERTRLKVAPDSVRFSIDLSSADFDTQGPVGDEVYDARMHDLIYLWEFGDTEAGDWTAPVNVLPEWKNRNVAKGPFVAHMFTIPKPESLGAGNGYEVSVMVIEPSSGKIAQATAEVFVEDPDDIYPGSQTICINPVGDSDFSEAPDETNNVKLNSDVLSYALMQPYQGATPKRVLLKRGEEYTVNWDMAGFNDTYVGEYGSAPEKPVLNLVKASELSQGQSQSLHASGGYGVNAGLSDLRLCKIKFQGTFNPITQVDVEIPEADREWAFGTACSVNVSLSEVDYDGIFSIATITGGTKDRRFHMDDCTATNFGIPYPLYMHNTDLPTVSGVLTGCRIAQQPGSHETNFGDYDNIGDRGAGEHSPVRWQDIARIHMRGCDFFHTDRLHNCLRLNDSANTDGNITNIHSMSLEGGVGMLSHSPGRTNGNNRSVVSNVILDGLIYIGSYGSTQVVETYATGITMRNCLAIIPNTPRNSLIQFRAWFQQLSYGTYDPDVVGAAPVKLYNNTFVLLRSAEENQNYIVGELNNTYSDANLTALSFENNIVHQPNYTVQVKNTYAPLTTTRLPWDSRNTGLRDPGMMLLHEARGTSGTGRIYYDGADPTMDVAADEVLTFSSGATAKAEVSVTDKADGSIYLYDISGTISDNDTFTGSVAAFGTVRGELNTDQLETEYATPNADLAYYRPDTGSAALGGWTTGNKSYLPIDAPLTTSGGDAVGKRPDPPSIGAWEAS